MAGVARREDRRDRLAVLRCDQRPGDMVGGNGVRRSIVSRWVREVVGLLAARAPRLDRALQKIARKGGGVVLPVFVLRRLGAGVVLLVVLSWACVGRLRSGFWTPCRRPVAVALCQ
ncbi:hypothetical protein TUSST3_54780 [Streptomyces sp. TUS-ST3]|nr:hypothetical protein TUSST3_54780 [Streptomyces sp. TUS-ST3]